MDSSSGKKTHLKKRSLFPSLGADSEKRALGGGGNPFQALLDFIVKKREAFARRLNHRNADPARRPGMFLLYGACCLGLLLGVFLLVQSVVGTSKNEIVERGATEEAERLATTYADFERDIALIDDTLASTLKNMGASENQMLLTSREQKSIVSDGTPNTYAVRTYEVTATGRPDQFFGFVGDELYNACKDCVVEQVSADSWQVSVSGHPTHKLVFPHTDKNIQSTYQNSNVVSRENTPKPENGAAASVAAQGATPRLAIVIDDLGEGMKSVKQLIALDIPITYSILPRSTLTAKVVRKVRDAGGEIILHQPMEPVSYPKHSPGPGAVMVKMSDEQIRKVVRENFERVPGAVALSNHMGSRVTQNSAAMRSVLREVKNKHLFILDSLTHPKSIVPKEAKKAGVPWLRRDVFIDVTRTYDYVTKQLKKAERLALKKGTAIALGHPHQVTMRALKDWSKHKNAQVQVVPLSALLKAPASLAEKEAANTP